MLSFTTVKRYLPRTPQEHSEVRRTAALRAQVEELTRTVAKLEREQDIQLQRIAQIQQTLDELAAIIKKESK